MALPQIPTDYAELYASLTEKQRAFFHEYLVDFNAERAAIRAGYACNKSRATGERLANHPKIKPILDEMARAHAASALVTPQRLVRELAAIGFSDMANYVEVVGGEMYVKRLDDIPPHQRRAIKSLKPTKFGIAIELHSKDFALGMLAKHLGPDFAPTDEQRMKNVTPAQGPVMEIPDDGSSQ